MTSEASRTNPRTLRVLTVAVAVVAPVTAWILIEEVIGIELRSPVFASTGESVEIGLLEVTVTSLAFSLAAWGVLALLERWTKKPAKLWTMAVSIGLLASLIGPLGGTGLHLGARVALVFLHGLVAATLIAGIRPTIMPEP